MAASTSTNRIQRVREKSLLRFAFRSRGQATRPTGQSRRTQIQRIRSRLCRRGFGLRRRRTSSWWRRTRFSSARSLRERQKSVRMRSSIERKPSTGAGAYQGRARRGLDDPRSTFAALQPAILRQSQPGLCIPSPDQSTVQSASSTTLPSGSETNTDRLP